MCVLVAAILTVSPAYAGPCARVVPTSTPCEGVAMPVSAAKQCARSVVDLAATRESLRACEAKRQADRDEAAAMLAACETHRRARVAALQQQVRDLERVALRPPPAPGWYESPWLWLGVGAIIGGAAGWHARALVR